MTRLMAPALVSAAVFGLLIGSFLNVVAWRLPRGESLVAPRSKCPGCGRQLAAYDNIPILSWLALRGRCRNCGQPISVRYPIVEALTAGLYVAVVAGLWDDARKIVLGLALVTVLVPIAVIDLDVRRIPNPLVIAGSLAALVVGLVLGPSHVPEQLIAGAAALLFFFLPALVHQKGMGMGDVKLAGMLGLYLGRGVAPAILLALVLGTLAGLAIIAVKGVSEGRRTKVPFGPFLATAAVICLFVGDAIVDGYLDR
jgi:leader peptidase (prepilin peptidase)/N-methyltransferase